MSEKLVFDHVAGAGKITKGDFIHAPAALYGVSNAEIDKRMAEGWAVDEWHTPRRMYQARQVRLRVPQNYTDPVLPPGVSFKLDFSPDVDALERVYDAYRRKKGFSDHLPIRKTLELVDRRSKAAIVFKHNGEIVAFTLFRAHPPAMSSLQFCWDYATPKLRLGFISQEIEFLVARAMDCDYVYIGPGYETVCRYKASLPGFEWWTGSEWSRDKHQFCSLLERDSCISTVEELMNDVDHAT